MRASLFLFLHSCLAFEVDERLKMLEGVRFFHFVAVERPNVIVSLYPQDLTQKLHVVSFHRLSNEPILCWVSDAGLGRIKYIFRGILELYPAIEFAHGMMNLRDTEYLFAICVCNRCRYSRDEIVGLQCQKTRKYCQHLKWTPPYLNQLHQEIHDDNHKVSEKSMPIFLVNAPSSISIESYMDVCPSIRSSAHSSVAKIDANRRKST